MGNRYQIPKQLTEVELIKKMTSIVSHVPPFIISGVIHPFLIVVLLLGSDALPALDLSLTSLCTMFGFLVLVYKCKAPPSHPPTLEQHCNVYFIGFISSFFSSRCCSVLLYSVFLSPVDCDDMYLPHSSSPAPPFSQCVLISNVCGFADGFMKKTMEEKKRNRQR